jgi:hypothetical protein
MFVRNKALLKRYILSRILRDMFGSSLEGKQWNKQLRVLNKHSLYYITKCLIIGYYLHVLLLKHYFYRKFVTDDMYLYIYIVFIINFLTERQY